MFSETCRIQAAADWLTAEGQRFLWATLRIAVVSLFSCRNLLAVKDSIGSQCTNLYDANYFKANINLSMPESSKNSPEHSSCEPADRDWFVK